MLYPSNEIISCGWSALGSKKARNGTSAPKQPLLVVLLKFIEEGR